MKKRVLSLALCLVLVVGLFSGLTVNASASRLDDLKKEIADVSLGKQANVCTAFSVCSSARKEDAGEEYEEGMAPVESMLQMFRIQLPQPQVADVICLFYLNKYLFAGKMCHASFRLFLS